MSGILNHQSADCEFIVVGSGAGGGTIAARLAEAGRTVLLLEAGGDPRTLSGADELSEGNRLPEDYDVPAFHAFASENEAMKWDYYVRHYADRDFQQRDPKYVAAEDGILYPRAGTLGGCTAHNAMILAYPQNSDWDDIASLTGDKTWNADHMRTYFERLERCRHRPLYRWLSKAGINPTRHGFEGWLSTERAVPVELLVNRALAEAVATGAIEAFAEEGQYLKRIHWALESGLDFNDWRLVRDASTGIRYLPLTTNGHARVGTRERVLDVARRFPERLRIELNTLVTRVLFDDGNRAIGVECQRGQRLYRAHANPNAEAVTSTLLYASREVILAGGAFNSPQLLMLSGIGPREELERFNIPLRMELPGVGRNLQDRYEIAVVNRMKFDAWKAYSGARFDKNDQQFREWKNSRGGIYSTNGSVLTIFRHSRNGGEIPDLFCMSLLARFAGYFPGYSRVFAQKLNYLTWVVLKAHARNRSGEVTLRSADPRDPPQINFNYFQNGGEEDLAAVLDGIRFVRRLSANLKAEGLIAEEEMPGEHLQSDEELKEFVRTHAWGHHASCSCPIGPIETGGALSSDFRVHGVRGLRVVDASIFPRIPGFFIVSAIYTVAEKAAAVILQDLA